MFNGERRESQKGLKQQVLRASHAGGEGSLALREKSYGLVDQKV